jgi:polar amino acid transport system substrate-binding protein
MRSIEMNRTTTGTFRVAAGLVLGVAAMLPSACGSSTPAVQAPVHKARFSQALHDQLPQSVKDKGVLRAGSSPAAPMGLFGPDGRTFIGVDPDIGGEIGHVLGVRIEFIDSTFDELIADVVKGDLDIAMSGITDTPERAKRVDFVNYFTAGTSIIVRRGNPAAISALTDLCGKVVTAMRGTVHEDLLARTQKDCGKQPIVVKTYRNYPDALVELRMGRAVATLDDYPLAVDTISSPRNASKYQLATIRQFEPAPYGIAVAKNQAGLRDALQGALKQLLSSGVYGDVLSKWNLKEGAIKEITINSNR